MPTQTSCATALALQPAMESRRWLRLLGHLTTTITVFLLVTPASSNSNDDLRALLSFKSLVTNDPSGALSSWSAASNSSHGGLCRTWTGVTCSSSTRHPCRVVAVRLQGLRLAGTISPLLGNLTRLHVLDLSDNKLEGEIPPSLGSCSALRRLNLSANHLSGNIPPAIGHLSKLVILNIRHNNISGIIPHSLANLTALTMFSIADNSVRGQIPPWLGNLTALTDLNIGVNMMSGHVPPALSKLTNLQGLYISYNKFEGVVPPSLFNISSLEEMNLGSNHLSGSLPPDMGFTLPNLRSFSAFYNQFEGQIPASLLNISFLERFILHGNRFQGRIPPHSGLNGRLTVFEVGNNNLQATVPKDWDFLTSLANCSNLIALNLQLNNLSGILPNIIANLSQELEYIIIGGNQISGHVPIGLGRYYKLTRLQLAGNLFTGSIPSDIGNLSSLHELELHENRFSGEIPSSLGNIKQLNLLALSSNYLEGGIPVTLGNLSMLNYMNLSSNLLSGKIPQAIISISSLTGWLDLSNNALDGTISPLIGQLVNLGAIDLSSNKLSGEIPDTIARCLELQFIYLQGNLLGGQIPKDLNVLRGLQELDLSNNKLSGPIPEFFESFQFLHKLNLSFNHLSGPVPTKGIFSNASSVSLASNDMLCGGPLFFHFPTCRPSLAPTRPAHRRMLHILIFSMVGAFISAIFCTAAYCCFKKPRDDTVASQDEQDAAFLGEVYQRVSYTDLCVATDSFSEENLIGRGSFGSVFAGTFSSTGNLTTVAVKVLDLQRKGATRSFLSECNALKRVKHRKLVKIISVCDSLDHRGDEFKAFVLEFISNGSLDEWLHPSLEKTNNNPQKRHLTLMQRLNIAIDVAEALEYLHHHINPCIVHCDVKPSNILLDDEMVAHVSDFGLAKIMSAQGSGQCLGESTSAGIKGTIGYLAPEYGMGTEISIEGDIYSYGVLLLEMLSARRPTDALFDDITSLPKYVEMAYPDNLLEIMDTNITRSENPQEMIDMFIAPVSRLGLACCRGSARQRIRMDKVVKELSAIKKACEFKYSPFVHPYDNGSSSSSTSEVDLPTYI